MIVCIDSGNSRIKWGVHHDGAWLAQGALAHADVAQLVALPAQFQPTQVMLANVAGDAVEARIRQALADWQPRFRRIQSGEMAGGVRNGYENPGRLGVDRWCALIGAHALHPQACVVVMAGTATTIDSLTADGHFIGGLILPGVDLMCRSLARDTAALPLAQGQHQAYPRNTDDAIISGCLEAQAGAIERAVARLTATVKDETTGCLISGGAAALLTPLLTVPYQPVDNLVLEGLRQLANQS
jgi:type III pantothenate kinase